MSEREEHTCPFCKEVIKPAAVKCKHCHSLLSATSPSHEGTCPFCKEEVHPEAIRCKHCKSSLISNAKEGCGCEGGPGAQVAEILHLLKPGNVGVSGNDLKCALEYLDCLDGPLSQGVCAMIHTICRSDLGGLGSGKFARRIR